MVKQREEVGIDAVVGSSELIASEEMCQYCFDVLLKKLLPRSAMESSWTGDRVGIDVGSTSGSGGGGSASASRSNGSSPKRRWKEKLNHGGGRSGRSVDGDKQDKTDSKKLPLRREIYTSYTPPTVECPLFVTWDKRRFDWKSLPTSAIATPASSNVTDDDGTSSNDATDELDYDLRGCIGTLTPRPLHHALSEFALHSALRDRRFDPITLEELPLVRVGVSLLVKYEECDHCHDWEVGVHGIIIRFECGRGKGYSATYLPEVAKEQRWNQEDTVFSLIRKAGYRGPIDNELIDKIQCTRYQSSKKRMTYQNYVNAKYEGEDPLKFVDLMTSAVVDEALRQRVRASKPCVNL